MNRDLMYLKNKPPGQADLERPMRCVSAQIVPARLVGALKTVALMAALCVGGLACLNSSVAAQDEEVDIWEFSPYKVRVWIAVDYSYNLPLNYVDEIAQRIHWSSEDVDLSGWKVTAEPAPASWRSVLLQGLESISLPEDDPETEEDESEADPVLNDALSGDKLILLTVKSEGNGFELQGREFDCRTRIWGPLTEQQTESLSVLPHLCYQTVASSFVPLVRIEDVNVDSATAIARVRAAGFHQSGGFGSEGESEPSRSPVWVESSDVFLPLIRKTSRSGKLDADNVRIVEWTYLTIDSREGVVLRCSIHSASRTPLGGRSSRRVEKIGMVIRPTQEETVLALETRELEPKRLPGYDILVAKSEHDEKEVLGKTDWKGEIVVEKTDDPLRIVYVRSGKRNLARLPIVPGYKPHLSAGMYDDDVRRRAEGIVKGLETEFLIIVARREMLSIRILNLVANDEVKVADELYQELRELPTMDQFMSKVDSMARTLVTDDRREAGKIETMFNQLRRIVTQQLSRDISSEMREEIERYKAANPGWESTEGDADLTTSSNQGEG